MAKINIILHLDKDCIVINNNEKYLLNSQGEFNISGTRYITFKLPVTLRTHISICNYHDKSFHIPAIIEYSKAVDLIKKLLNISAHNLSVNSIPCDKSISEAYDDIKESLKNMISLIKVDEYETQMQADKIMKIFAHICDLIQPEEIEQGILASYPMCYKINVDLQKISMGKLLEYLLDYIVAYNIYHPQVISYHSLNNNIGYLYLILYILTVDASILVSDIFTKREDIILHSFFSIFIDILTDKCGKILFIEEKNVYAATILRKYHTHYPVLAKITSRQAALLHGHQLDSIFSEAQNEGINLIPYLVSYTMPDEERLLYLYEYFLHNKSYFQNHNSLPPIEYLGLLKKITESVHDSFYSINIMQELIPYFLQTFTN